MADWGRLLWVTFLGKTRKVTSCRAAPGEVVFDWIPAFAGMTVTLRQAQGERPTHPQTMRPAPLCWYHTALKIHKAHPVARFTLNDIRKFY